MGSGVEALMKRFIKAVNDGDDMRKVHTILTAVSKEHFMAWKDDYGQDALHYAVIAGNAEAVDFLLKLGYFVAPYEPPVNLYAHLAAKLGFRSVLSTVLQHRPEDFKEAEQPLWIPPGLAPSKRSNYTKESELFMPAVVGNQVCVEKSVKSGGDREKGTNSFEWHASGQRSSSRSEKWKDSVNCLQKTEPTSLGDSRQREQDWGATRRPSMSLRRSTVMRVDEDDSNSMGGVKFRRKSMLQKRHVLQKRRNSSPDDTVAFSQGSISMSKVKPLSCTPLQVAARSRHVDCVKTLLEMCILKSLPQQKSNKGYLTLAALANDAPSLKLLIHSALGYSGNSGAGNASLKDDYRNAVEVCLGNVFPECLEVLLDYECVETKHVFKQINFFHVLYSQPCSSNMRETSLHRLPLMTELLIQRGHDVKAKVPPRTYPLYSLIHSCFFCNDFNLSDYVITCMKLLMSNGADPNFDEVQFEQQLLPPARYYGGRNGFSSALHCVIQSMEQCRDKYPCKGQAVRFVEECLDMLTAFNADIEKMGRIGWGNGKVSGDVLWQFANSSVAMGLERALLHTLIRFGAQPQRKINGQYAVNVYLDSLCALVTANNTVARDVYAKHKRDLGQMISLMCAYMAPWHIKEVQQIFNFKHRKCTEDYQQMYSEDVNAALEEQRQKIHTLRNIAAWQVWKLCGRKAENVKKLPVPKEIKTHVLPLVLLKMVCGRWYKPCPHTTPFRNFQSERKKSRGKLQKVPGPESSDTHKFQTLW